MEMSKLMSDFEDKKEVFYHQVLGTDFEELLIEARKDPETASYLDLRITKEEAIGYLLAAARASGLDTAKQTEILVEMERHFMIMSPEEARRIYAESWYI